MPTVIKKYSNRRLYDTSRSRYITLEELADFIRRGEEVRVVDAKSGEDLTQATLAQIIIESRGAGRLLPVPLLVQLIRMGDDALAEFFGRYVTAALELYWQAKQAAQAVAPFNPFAQVPFQASNVLARMLSATPWGDGGLGFGGFGGQAPPPGAVHPGPMSAAAGAPMGGVTPAPSGATPAASGEEVAELRRELEALKQSLRKKRR